MYLHSDQQTSQGESGSNVRQLTHKCLQSKLVTPKPREGPLPSVSTRLAGRMSPVQSPLFPFSLQVEVGVKVHRPMIPQITVVYLSWQY